MAAIEVTLDNSDGNNIANGGRVVLRNSDGIPYVVTHNSTDKSIDVWAGHKSSSKYNPDSTGLISCFNGGANEQVGQSFTGNGEDLLNAVFKMQKFGDPTGNIYAKLYAHSGTYGTSSIPTESALATSAALDVSTLSTTLSVYPLVFQTPYTLTSDEYYVIVLDFSGVTGDASNSVRIRTDSLTPTHSGNLSYYFTSWASASNVDIWHVVCTTGDYDIFIEQDPINKPDSVTIDYGAPSAAIDSDDIIHISYYYMDGKATQLFYATFSTVTDLWLTTDVPLVIDIGEEPVYYNLYTAIAIDSNDVPHIAFIECPKLGGTVTYTLNYINRVGGSWNTKVAAYAAQGVGTSQYDISIDYDNLPVIAIKKSSTGSPVALIGNLNNAISFTLEVLNSYSGSYATIAVDIGGNHWVGWIESTNGFSLIKHNYGDSWATWQTKVYNSDASSFSSVSIYADGTDIYVFYENDANDIAWDMYDGSTWIGETVLETGTFNTVKAAWANFAANDSAGSLGFGIVDSYPSDGTTFLVLRVTYPAISQSVTGDGTKIAAAGFDINKFGNPTGTFYYKLYAHSGIFGTSSLPTGPVLAIASADISTLPTTSAPYILEFDTPYQTIDGTNYCIVVEYSGGNDSNYLQVRYDTSDSNHPGNRATYDTSWEANVLYDIDFTIYAERTFPAEISYVFTDESSPYDIWFNTLVLDAGTNDELTGSGIVAQAPALGTGTLSQEHDLVATGITSQAPVLDTGIVTSNHDLTATGIVSQAPILVTAVLTEDTNHELTAQSIVSQSPVLDTASLEEDNNLAAQGIVTAATVLETATLTEDTNNELAGQGITASAPTLTLATLVADSILIAASIVTGSPTLATVDLTENNNLTAQAIASSPPVLETAVLAEDTNNELTGQGITASAPILATAGLSVNNNLAAQGIASSPPVLETAVLTEDTNNELTGQDITASSSLLATADLAENNNLSAQGIVTGAPVLDTAVLTIGSVTDDLTAQGILASSPVLSLATLAQNHVFISSGIVAQAPILSLATLAQNHVFISSGIVTQAPILTASDLSESSNLVAQSIAAASPALETAVLTEDTNNELTSQGIVTAAPVLAVADLAENNNLAAQGIVSLAPILETAVLTEDVNNELTAQDITASPPVLESAVLTEDTNNELTAQDITAAAPTVDLAILVADSILVASPIISGTPVLGTSDLTESVSLVAQAIVTAAPTLSTAVLTEDTNNELVSSGILAGNPVVSLATLSTGTIDNLVGHDILAGTPVLTTAALSQEHSLVSQSVVSGAPILETSELTQDSNLIAQSIVSDTPVLAIAAISQNHSLDGQSIEALPPVTDTAQIVANSSLIAQDIVAIAPTLDEASLSQIHSLVAQNVISGIPVIQLAFMGSNHNLIAVSLLAGQPILEIAYKIPTDPVIIVFEESEPGIDVNVSREPAILFVD